MHPTKSDWADNTWNPISGCYYSCSSCMARRRATLDDGRKTDPEPLRECDLVLHDLEKPITDAAEHPMSFPYGFEPTFHRYRLGTPGRIRKQRTILVGTMGDLFGDWIPDEWIQEVFRACMKAEQHRYLFQTRNPTRYIDLAEKGLLPDKPNIWYGYTATHQKDLWTFRNKDECPCKRLFISIQPLLEPIYPWFSKCLPADWVIVGAKAGPGSERVMPKREWIEGIVWECHEARIPVFLRNSLAGIMGDELEQEYPWKKQSGKVTSA